MQNLSADRFKFIANALLAEGPFRPVVSRDSTGAAISVGATYLARHERETLTKFARRNELCAFASPLHEACSRFVGYMSARSPQRSSPHALYDAMMQDIDGRGNAAPVFWQNFALHAKARGSMLLLVDMPEALPADLASQVAMRAAPVWTPIAPEAVQEYALGADGKFDSVTFSGTWTRDGAESIPCAWTFTRSEWLAVDNKEKKTLGQGLLPLGECPVLAFVESGEFPSFGAFSAIADLSKLAFNLESQLDEILMGQTFSLLTMQVPDNASEAAKLSAAQTAGQTIGTANLLVHTGQTPQFVAPPDGPATVYMQRLDRLNAAIDRIGLNVATVDQQESGIAMQMRFARINGELASFSQSLEDLERRAWMLSAKWLGMEAMPDVSWPRDFNVADLSAELEILTSMRAAGMPASVIAEQEKRIVHLQFASAETDRLEQMVIDIDQRVADEGVM